MMPTTTPHKELFGSVFVDPRGSYQSPITFLLKTKKRASLTHIPDLTGTTTQPPPSSKTSTRKPKRPQLISPLTLLNDHAIAGKDRDLFKGLKGDKQILRHYNQVDRIIADIQQLSQQ
jgi:hypothetical protein